MFNKIKKKLQINKWLYPGVRIKRWVFLIVLSIIVGVVGFSGLLGKMVEHIRIESINIDYFFKRLQRLKFIDIFLLILAIGGIILAIRRMYFSILTVFVPEKDKTFIKLAYKRAKLKRGPKVVVLGGGTGQPNVLRGLKEYTSNISAIVTVADDGGSSGRLRKDYEILPPGDIRNCIVALADEETLIGKLFKYRFEKGGELAGHNFGNLFITALTNVVGDFSLAIKESGKILAINGEVLPVTLDNIQLKAKLVDGREVIGQSKIPAVGGKIDRIEIIPQNCKPYKQVLNAIKNSEIIIIGPGSLYTSIIPNLIIPGIKETIKNNHKALKIYICNIMTQHGETDNYKVSDHIKAIFKHTYDGIIDYVIANNVSPKEELLKKYKEEKSYPVEIDKEEINKLGVKIIEGKLFKDDDQYIRHDPEILAQLIMKISLV